MLLMEGVVISRSSSSLQFVVIEAKQSTLKYDIRALLVIRDLIIFKYEYNIFDNQVF